VLLSLVVKPKWLLSQGEHLGFPWVVIHHGLGYRSGHIKLPKGHPWEDPDHDIEEPISVHGGVTYFEVDTDSDGFWIGFDCGHVGDAPDPTLPREYSFHMPQYPGDTIKDTSFVENECHQLCEQAHSARFRKIPKES
jgi:hypothetical protein